RRLEAEGLARLPLNPRLAHALDDGRFGIRFHLELAREDDRLVEPTGAIAEAQIVPLAGLQLPPAVHDDDGADELADLSRAIAGIVAQSAADRAGRADQRLQPCQAVAGGLRDQCGERSAAAGADAIALDGDLVKRRRAEPQDDAAHALIAHQ